MSIDTLIRKIDALRCPVVAGLDPKLAYIPEAIQRRHFEARGETLEAAAECYYEFCCGILDALHGVVPAVKPQAAYFEALGYEGVLALKRVIDYAKSLDYYVILDAKRGDIGSTSEAYADAYLGQTAVGSRRYAPFGCDALTVNTYLGSDGLRPFLEVCKTYGRSVFALVKTSNPSSGELQDLEVDGVPVYSRVGALLESIAPPPGAFGYTDVGAVVGATHPGQLARLREQLAHTFFLVPGYGAQGGGAADVQAAFDRDGRGAIVNSSRGILCAWQKTGGDYMEAARAEALRMRDDILSVL